LIGNKNAPKVRINNQIISPRLRVIDDTGENLGVIALEEALKIAASKNLDLVEIAPEASPPVAKVVSFDKFRYQKEKEAKGQRKQNRVREMKQVQISSRSAKNDLLIKVKRVEKFLGEGHKVEILMRLRGREKANTAWARQKLEEFIRLISAEYKILSDIRFIGSGFNIQIDKKR